MGLSKCIPAPRVRALRRAFLPLGCGLAVLLAGCASQSEYHEASAYGGTGPQVTMEDDGLPAQTPPLRRTRTGPSDPSEPFSPNYGPPPLPGEKAAPALPVDLSPAFQRQITSAVNV